MRRTARLGGWVAAAASTVLVLTGCTSTDTPRLSKDEATVGTLEGIQDDLGSIPSWVGPFTGEIALADGLRPPTNSWIAPAVFAPQDRPVFTGVLSARLSADELGIGLPQPEVSADVVMGVHRDDVILGLPSDDYEITRVDELTAVTTYTRAEEPVGEVRLAEGWPYLQYRALADHQVAVEALPDGYELATGGSRDGETVTLTTGQDLFIWAVPEGSTDAEEALRAGAVPLEGSEVSYEYRDAEVSTTLRYLTEGDRDTVLAAAPHARLEGDPSDGGSYPSILGDLRLVRGISLVSATAIQEPRASLDLSGLTDAERTRVEELLETDISELTFTAPDSYHGGKEVQRAANLVVLAEQLGRDDLAAVAREATVAELDEWFDPAGCSTRQQKCFHYDEGLGGMVGLAPSYGSDEFNDHHFHYGHFLYAAGVLAADDPALAERWAPVADLVAKDYGSPSETSLFPAHRAFDPWRGHSFASGTAPFADGNNQESSSEAINGYAGLALWAKARGDERLLDHARWLLSHETASTVAYWLDPQIDAPYGHPSVSLNWQGKRDFATFFSPDPSAVVGIQFIPMAPTQVDYLSRHPEAVQAMVDHVGDLTPGRPLVDLDVAALAVVDPASAEQALEAFGPDTIDPGISWSYLQALVLSR